jgi:hypothetical protein
MSSVAQHQHHSHRSMMIAAGATLLVVLGAGAVYEVSQSNDQAATNELPNSLPSVHLHGSSSMEGQWNHAGTTSGGHTEMGQ